MVILPVRGKCSFLYVVDTWFDVTKCKNSNFKILVAFLPVFVTDTKITFVHNFVTSLNMRAKNLSEQFKRWMASEMCVVWKSHWVSIFHKEKSEIIYNIVVLYGTDMKPRLNRYWWKWGKSLSLSVIIDLLTFFTFIKWCFHDIYQFSVVIPLKICFNLWKCPASFPFCKIF